MMFRTASTLLLLSGSASAFNVNSSAAKKGIAAVKNNLGNVVAAGVISAATILPVPLPAFADSGLVTGTPLESKLAAFGAASYPVFNSVTDVTPLAEKFLDLVDKKVKAPDAADLANKAADGLLAIPDAAILEYRGVLKQVVYSGVSATNCVTLGGSGTAAAKLAASPAVASVDAAKIASIRKKFTPANSAVPIKDGNICLPGSAAASEKLWVAQAELTLSMPKAEATALVGAIKKAGAQATRPALVTLVAPAESVFSKSGEATKMKAAGLDVEPNVIATVNAALK